MVKSEIDRIKKHLAEGATHCDLEVDDDDRWNIRFDDEDHRSADACEITPILSLEFSGALCEERPQVCRRRLNFDQVFRLHFDQGR